MTQAPVLPLASRVLGWIWFVFGLASLLLSLAFMAAPPKPPLLPASAPPALRWPYEHVVVTCVLQAVFGFLLAAGAGAFLKRRRWGRDLLIVTVSVLGLFNLVWSLMWGPFVYRMMDEPAGRGFGSPLVVRGFMILAFVFSGLLVLVFMAALGLYVRYLLSSKVRECLR